MTRLRQLGATINGSDPGTIWFQLAGIGDASLWGRAHLCVSPWGRHLVGTSGDRSGNQFACRDGSAEAIARTVGCKHQRA